MIPDPETVSAFAVYHGLSGTTKSKKKRLRKMARDSKYKKVLNNLQIKNSSVKEASNSKVRKKRVQKLVKTQPNNKVVRKVSPTSEELTNTDEPGVSSIHTKRDVKQIIKSDLNYEKPKTLQLKVKSKTSNIKHEMKKKSSKVNTCNKEPVKKKKLNSAERRLLLKEEVIKQAKGMVGSVQIGKKVLESIIFPTVIDQFFSEFWEKNPFLRVRGQPNYFSNYISTPEIDNMLRYNMIMFGKNLDVTTYTDGTKETHNPDGRAHAHVVWDFYSNGCSIRLLNPQTFLPKIHQILAALQEYFGCFVGCNAYLTPPNSQGFAPHYDDIEAFVLQIEGKKRWKVYSPRFETEFLPKISSPNFSQSDIGKPVLDVVLSPGDTLYFPRGFIHQAVTLPGKHSLHLTISAYQNTSWSDLLSKALPEALKKATESSVEYRQGLPLGYLRHAGLGYKNVPSRKILLTKMKKLISNLEKFIDIDDAVDKMGMKFMHEALPPVLSQDEGKCSVHNGGIQMGNKGKLSNRSNLKLNSCIRWMRANCFRLIEEDVEGEGKEFRLYFTLENSKEYEAEEPQYLVLPDNMLLAVKYLIHKYPAFSLVDHLPNLSSDEKLILVNDLWDRGLLLTEEPLVPDPSEDDSNVEHFEGEKRDGEESGFEQSSDEETEIEEENEDSEVEDEESGDEYAVVEVDNHKEEDER